MTTLREEEVNLRHEEMVKLRRQAVRAQEAARGAVARADRRADYEARLRIAMWTVATVGLTGAVGVGLAGFARLVWLLW